MMAINLNQLNERQKEAVLHIEGPLLIIAGAGSGKTRTLTYRLAYLIEKGINPRNILAVTFTNKAAQEMKERVASLLYSQKITDTKRKDTENICVNPRLDLHSSARPFIGTFHSFGAKILRAEGKTTESLFGRNAKFVIYDEDDSLGLIKKIMKDLDVSKDQFNPAVLRERISGLKAELVSLEQYQVEVANLNLFDQVSAKIWQRYEERLRENNAFDFDDLIFKTVELFQQNKEILEKYQNRYRHILIDEYQDTNHAQYILTKILAQKYRNLCVVGDDQQSIYRWRKADYRNILNFELDFPEAKVVMLEENYRSTQNILDAANSLIEHNIYQKKKYLWTKNSRGALIYLVEAANEREEADFVVETIGQLIEERGYQPKDFAVLYRVNAQSRSLEEAFLNSGIPYQIIGGIKFYQRKEIKDILAYLRLIQNLSDRVSLERIINIPPRGVGKKSLALVVDEILSQKLWIEGSIHQSKTLRKFSQPLQEFIQVWAKARELSQKSSLTDLIRFIIKETKYDKYLGLDTEEGAHRWENILELLSAARPFDDLSPPQGLEAFLETVSLIQEGDERDAKKNSVNLMTLHSAKGLEFDVIFITGCEEGLLPHARSLRQGLEEELEEERRLAYVGITRAKKEVYLLCARRRLLFGSVEMNQPSRFLKEIPSHLIKFVSTNEWDNEEDEEEWIEID